MSHAVLLLFDNDAAFQCYACFILRITFCVRHVGILTRPGYYNEYSWAKQTNQNCHCTNLYGS